MNSDGESLLQKTNQTLHRQGRISIAEDFDRDPLITKPVASGGKGFDSHWAGLSSVIRAISKTPSSEIDFADLVGGLSGTNERVNFTETHDEVGHPPLKIRIPSRVDPANPGSLVACKRALLGAMILMTAPGLPMFFQGQEFLENQTFAYPTGTALDWSKVETYAGIVSAFRDLIALRKNIGSRTGALLSSPLEIFHRDEAHKVIAYRCSDSASGHHVFVLANFGEQPFKNYQIGLPHAGQWTVRFSSDDVKYSSDFGGSPYTRSFTALSEARDGLEDSTVLELAPFTAVVLGN